MQDIRNWLQKNWQTLTVTVVICAGLAGVLSYRPWRERLVGLVSQTEVVRETAVLPTPDGRLEERLGLAEDHLKQLEQLVQTVQQGNEQLKTQFQQAIREVAKTNDTLVAQAASGQQGVAAGGSAPAATGKININTADAAALDALPGIGPSYAQKIVEYRQAHGPFTSIDQLTDVTGIGPATLAKFRDQIEI